ncbi:hypothetical protein Ahy_A02g010008 [Arachis hypogaea]|uniref:FAR1 domain-containing protein n=1 Tax=Arachis hypogaea TaxID=3818 RepID=A0A445EIW6_ARAHY|nr:hypothetical protein Ahy_A02g010008 [Arachis hypogaea]
MQRKDRKKDPRPITRCGCEARIKVHVDDAGGRWFVEQLCDNHNHPMLDARFRGLSWSHRAVKEADLHQINSMRKSGLWVPTIFHAFANQSGGFETVGFEIKNIYNAIEKQRRDGATDAESALKFLGTLRTTDSGMFWKYSLDTDSVADHGLEDHLWIVEMYAKKHSWSNAHIRGKLFAGLKTTSRCEALNMQLGKFIHNGSTPKQEEDEEEEEAQSEFCHLEPKKQAVEISFLRKIEPEPTLSVTNSVIEELINDDYIYKISNNE